ncbi:YdhK family protein [Planococcus lenghuensis]|uniref:DUF1541 domain-containing protein n=1 Tax=Planococcus lenghuensis TaxID=2213202 RepID=A0A1Q2L2B9_9BACL|nr:YdhK family protein [Planococcus lenghuensis]AQQ54610.1 hypothetical protein B0X71_16885 [Planococcus lenghuensis]
MINRKVSAGMTATVFVLSLAACSEAPEEAEGSLGMDMEDGSHEGMDMEKDPAEDMGMAEDAHEGMDHSGSAELPEGLQAAVDPAFEVGSQVFVETDHLMGMQGVEATISGAYDTAVYSISYTPEDGNPVENHKWVVHEELENPGPEPLEPGTEVTVIADHMAGMAGAAATIDTVEETTVYTIDYVTSSGEEVMNHMWVTGDELSAE